ncbi:MAG: hypothetical protein IPO66_20105 [Rhodanobacteraceae bacterium]|nr:hypothetical protein [Rhodanobacteraceae bacterium]
MVDFFAQAPQHLQGSLLLAMMRAQALLVAFTDGRRMLLIHFRDAAAVWQYQSQERCEAVQRIRDDNAWLMAFMPAGTGDSTRPLPAAPITLGAPARGHVDVLVGAHLRITRLPASRSWDWAWSQTLGPAFLSVFVDRSAVEIRQWLSENLPCGYAFDGDRVRATRNLQPERRLRHTDEIWTADGEIHFVHGYYRHVEPVDNARAVFLLRKLARAELGELSFDVFDGDYGSLCALGLRLRILEQVPGSQAPLRSTKAASVEPPATTGDHGTSRQRCQRARASRAESRAWLAARCAVWRSARRTAADEVGRYARP